MLHQAGVVHLDLFPSNIMWKFEGEGTKIEVKLIDFDAAHSISKNFTAAIINILSHRMFPSSIKKPRKKFWLGNFKLK